ncbi:hypothetical protein NADFUDRAFT_45461 [Nadsonia fulvescens var. elongata DSM 6958]|uniref:Uncharacterized protein n=1 Tax=Nadsonia fulvescens var. elongata DSM 6958 TaxID=857566 RepID=A0A1E3PPJ0_9ASCO|nr:hypothetical protein NADFUDRAFT_45461 [Nadsonia fulvescens var. elongata DSM 6958]
MQKYSVELLVGLQDSPLSVKPESLDATVIEDSIKQATTSVFHVPQKTPRDKYQRSARREYQEEVKDTTVTIPDDLEDSDAVDVNLNEFANRLLKQKGVNKKVMQKNADSFAPKFALALNGGQKTRRMSRGQTSFSNAPALASTVTDSAVEEPETVEEDDGWAVVGSKPKKAGW